MHLALFDLDHTLLPLDSDHSWSAFLGRLGAIDSADYNARNDKFYGQYTAGTLKIEEYLEFALQPLANNTPKQLHDWHRQFMAECITPAIKPAARALVDKHLGHGDLLAVITATNEFVTRPIATAFGIDNLLAIELEQQDGRYTGRHTGTPSFREGKVTRLHDWLGAQGKRLQDFEQSWFYSDSINDLPLLEAVTNPVAVNPDKRLTAIAEAREWPIMHLFEDSDDS